MGGIPEVVTSEQYGILVEPENPEQLAQAIQQALDRQWNVQQISDYAKQYSWENNVREVFDILSNAVNETIKACD